MRFKKINALKNLATLISATFVFLVVQPIYTYNFHLFYILNGSTQQVGK
jgi:hypothetical protein